jgi:hypothetical protein
MNWLMVVVGSLQVVGAVNGVRIGQGWRICVMNVLVGAANIVLAGVK